MQGTLQVLCKLVCKLRSPIAAIAAIAAAHKPDCGMRTRNQCEKKALHTIGKFLRPVTESGTNRQSRPSNRGKSQASRSRGHRGTSNRGKSLASRFRGHRGTSNRGKSQAQSHRGHRGHRGNSDCGRRDRLCVVVSVEKLRSKRG